MGKYYYAYADLEFQRSKKNLPEIILGYSLEEPIWGKQIDVNFALDLFVFVKELDGADIKRIDLTDIKAKSYGRRGLTMVMSHGNRQRILRLTQKGYRKELNHYMTLHRTLIEEERDDAKIASQVIDLRIPDLAFIH